MILYYEIFTIFQKAEQVLINAQHYNDGPPNQNSREAAKFMFPI